MGANDKGVVIGNEAVFTRLPKQLRGGLLGMDLLRLGLERADTAAAAVAVMTGLLDEFGQGGACGLEDKHFSYHNSFIAADPDEAWVLETAGPYWAALRVNGAYAISNRLTIGEEFDLSSRGLIDSARAGGLLKKGKNFNFASCFSDPLFSFAAAGRSRRARSMELLKDSSFSPGPQAAFKILRDHGTESYRPDSHLLLDRICAHAANNLTRKAAQTTGSLVACLGKGKREYWSTGTSAPCLSVFKPIWMDNGGPRDSWGPVPGAEYDPKTLWWEHESLHRAVLLDYELRREAFIKDRDELENLFFKKASETGPDARTDLTSWCFDESRRAMKNWLERVQAVRPRNMGGVVFRRFWKKMNSAVGVPVF